jgi:hypothetical protein
MRKFVTSRLSVISLLILTVFFWGPAQEGTCRAGVLNQAAKLRMPFIANQGQADDRVRFYAPVFGGAVFITEEAEVLYSLAGEQGGAVIKETFAGLPGEIRGVGKASARVSFFKGKDPSGWMGSIPAYEAVSLGEVYEGIEVRLMAYGSTVEKVFSVSPGAGPESIRVRLDGAEELSVNSEGELEARTGRGTVTLSRPMAYQEKGGKREFVEVSYLIDGNEYGFRVGEYDRGRVLVIDPLLSSTFLGGGIADIAHAVAVDSNGDVYVAGETISTTSFPTTPGAYDELPEGAKDAFVSKFTGDLTELLASTFLGGGSDDIANHIAVDAAGDVYVTGETASINFPTTPGAYDMVHAGNSDAFVSKLSGDLSALLASTLLGGGIDDIAYAVAVHLGNVYVAGETTSASAFPTTAGAYDETPNGASDAFVSKLDGDLTGLIASTFLGGGTADRAGHIAVDPAGNVFVTGETVSTDFPTTAGVYDRTHNGASDSFISRFDGDLTTLAASTFLGGGSDDMAYQIAISGADVFVTGETASIDFPTTPGAYDMVHAGDVDAFVSKLNGDLSVLLASTFLGGGLSDIAYSVGVDSSGNVYAAGETTSSGVDTEVFPTTPGAFDEIHNGNTDAFLSALSSNLSVLLSSTFLGGGDNDTANYVAVTPGGNTYVTGETTSTGGIGAIFPTTPDAYDTVHGGDSDVFVSLLSDIMVSPSELDFGRVQVGDVSDSHVVTISNTRRASTTLTGITLTDNTNYLLDVNGGPEPCGSASPTIGSDQDCTLVLTFSPMSDGTFSATLTVNSLGRVTLIGKTGKDGKNCFIATAAYGSAMDSHVQALRSFRDEHLLTNPLGTALVNLYYRVSPPVARYIGKHEAMRAATRLALAPVVYGVEHPLGAVLIVTGILAATGAWRWRRLIRRQ